MIRVYMAMVEDDLPSPFVDYDDPDDLANGGGALRIFYQAPDGAPLPEPPHGAGWVEVTGVQVNPSTVILF